MGTFYAYANPTIYASTGDIIVYQRTRYNTGEYSTSTGLFTASVSGVYAFHVNMVSCGSSSYQWISGGINLSSIVYGYIISGLDSGYNVQSGSSLFTLLVNEGEQVFVNVQGGSGCVRGESFTGHSSFAGFLIETTV